MGTTGPEVLDTSPADALRAHVSKKVTKLQNLLLNNTSSGKATAAMLRRAIGRGAGSDPSIWEITLGELPGQLVGSSDTPSFGEASAHMALALYALHQQSQVKPMHEARRGLGDAVRVLITQDVGADFESSPVIRRFNSLITSESVDEMTWHLRSLITQLRAETIPLDYGQLAVDLYRFNFAEARDGVRLRWGRQLYAARRTNNSDSNQ